MKRKGGSPAQVSDLGSADAHAPPRLRILAALVLAVACLYWARAVFIPIALALLISFLLSPAVALVRRTGLGQIPAVVDRKSTRLNSSHGYISYAVFCLKKKNKRRTGARRLLRPAAMSDPR